MSASTRNLRHGTLILRDGTLPTPNLMTIPIMDGDLDFTITIPTFVVKNRGRIDHKRVGDETEVDIKFSFKFEQWEYQNANTGVSPADALLQKGGAANWISSGPSCGPYAVDLVYRIADPCNANNYEELVFAAFNPETLNFKEGSEFNMISVSGKALDFLPDRAWVSA